MLSENIDFNQSIYNVLMGAQVPERDIDNHYSDLYLRATPQNTELLRRYYEVQGIKRLPEKFRSKLDNEEWYDIPFAYNPYWEEMMTKKGSN